MPESHYDFVVIGTGPAGEAAAMKAAKSGKRVAAIEAFTRVGGGATHWGTIPSKALRRAIRDLSMVFRSPLVNRMEVAPKFDYLHLMGTTNGIVDEQTKLRESFYDRNGVQLIAGRARFLDHHTLEVDEERGAKERVKADAIVIATGSRPYRPADVDFKHPRILDSDKVLGLRYTPRSMIIYGAGVVGCEYASMFNMMQVPVTLVNQRAALLSYLDEEVVDALSYHFADQNIRIMHNETYSKIVGMDDCVELQLQSGKRLRADVLLFANGRSGNVEDLGLEKIGVKANVRGQIPVNVNLQVMTDGGENGNGAGGAGQARIVGDPKKMAHVKEGVVTEGKPCLSHIYAAGDVIGQPSLASASYDQGRFAATHAIFGEADFKLVTSVPTGIFTSPEISSIGRTELQLTQEKIPYEAGKAHFKTLARAQIAHLNVGFLKILFHRETLEILGVHCFGEQATEIIHIGQAIMFQPPPNNTLKYFTTATFNYPTMAEAYRVAALNGLNRVF